MITISVAIQKGGAGKTTTTLNLAAALRESGKRCLLVDLDPQASLSQSLGFSDPEEPTIYHLLKGEASGRPVPIASAIIEKEGLDLVPASLDLASAELELVSIYGREQILSQILEQLDADTYDYVFLDCPPSMGMLTVNGLVASDYILMPMVPEFLSLKGAKSFLQNLNLIRRLNEDIALLGFVLTKYDKRKTMTQSVETALKEAYGAEKVFTSYIRSNIALAKAQEQGVDIYNFDKGANGAKDYADLAAEFLQKMR